MTNDTAPEDYSSLPVFLVVYSMLLDVRVAHIVSDFRRKGGKQKLLGSSTFSVEPGRVGQH
jgi:hypothetical protein